MLRTLTVVVAAICACAVQAHAQKNDGLQRAEVPGEIVVCFASPQAVDLAAVVNGWNVAGIDGASAQSAKMILRWQEPGNDHYTNMSLLSVGAKADTAALIRALQATPGVKWAEPNVMLIGDPRELVPNDPQYGQQYHHTKMQNNLAWDTTMGSASVIVAMTDDGIDMTHPDLTPNFWINSDEIAANAIDDDGNGFVDDINGWDFISNDNTPAHTGGDSHGTHTSGIVGARTNNSVGVAGTAGASRLMPIRFYSGAAGWTATTVASAFNYATNNGAKIISTSYNFDGWVGNATVTTAFQYLYDNGVLHLNSAGNNNQLNPPRQAFHQTLLVASTDNNDVKSSFSNYGTGIDIAAPGSNILSTLPGSTYGLNSGTSMSTPNAAGTAALIWAAHPTWTRDQVAAQLVATADNIDAQNPTLVNLLGGGRVNSFQGVTATLPAPKMLTTPGVPAEGGSVSSLTAFRLRFNQVMSPASVNNPAAFSMLAAGTDGAFGTGDDATIPLTWTTYRIGTNEIEFTIGGTPPACGRYRITANGAILENPFGTDFDGNANGTGGDSWQRTFNVEPCQGDVTCNATVDVNDLLGVVSAWGSSTGGRADLNGDGTVDVNDLLQVISNWGPCPMPPPVINNDLCANPALISTTGAFQFDTTGTTNSGPTPVTCTASFGSDVWIRFTPPASGTATVHTCAASTFDSYLLAYSGTCAALTQIACNDDFCNSNRAQISFPVTAGTPVLIRLGGWSSQQGTGTLTISVQ